MSYILDALRRADADRERERGAVPGLHTQALPDGLADSAPLPGLRRWLWPAAALVAVLLAAAAGWAWFSPPAPVEPVAPVPVTQPSLAPARVAEPAAPATADPAPAALAEPPQPARPAAPVARAPQRPAAVVEATRPAAKAPVMASRASPATATVVAAPAAASAATPASGAAPTRVASLAELPEEARRGLPPLAFGGSIYASTPANRLLIVNGQLVHEGESLGTGVTLEQIKPRAAVIVIRGQRYEVGY